MVPSQKQAHGIIAWEVCYMGFLQLLFLFVAVTFTLTQSMSFTSLILFYLLSLTSKQPQFIMGTKSS